MYDLRKYIHILEAYQEQDSTFESDGKLYDLNTLFVETENAPVAYFKVEDLAWVLEGQNINYEEGSEDARRLQNADLKVPILVTPYKNSSWLVVDGLHRLVRAIKEGEEMMVGRVVPEESMNRARLGNFS